MMGMSKEYEAELILGSKSNTYDAQGEIIKVSDKKPDRQELEQCINGFKGEIIQKPPAFSAKKINGKRAYEMARKGEEVELKPQKIKIHSIKLLSYEYPKVKILVSCGSGTYIRSLIHDIGIKLEVGAYMSALLRTKVGDFAVKKSLEINNLKKETIKKDIINVSEALTDFERIDISEEQYKRLKFGQKVELDFKGGDSEIPTNTFFRGFFNGELVGILENKGDYLFKFKKQLHL